MSLFNNNSDLTNRFNTSSSDTAAQKHFDKTGAGLPHHFDDIKMICLDLDGTLLNSDKVLSERNRRALTEAAARGIYIVPTTGRLAGALTPSVASLPFLQISTAKTPRAPRIACWLGRKGLQDPYFVKTL